MDELARLLLVLASQMLLENAQRELSLGLGSSEIGKVAINTSEPPSISALASKILCKKIVVADKLRTHSAS